MERLIRRLTYTISTTKKPCATCVEKRSVGCHFCRHSEKAEVDLCVGGHHSSGRWACTLCARIRDMARYFRAHSMNRSSLAAMRLVPLITLIISSLVALPSVAQIQSGFQPQEARDMIMLCTTHTFIDLYGSDEKMIPTGYERVYSSVPTPLDNKFEIFRKGDLAVIEIRGSTASMMSWMVNVHSSMVPAKGRILVNGKKFDYVFAEDTSAAVHAGFALAVSTIADDVLAQIKELHKSGVHDVIITGHSQGGALAHLLRAYLEHLPGRKLAKDTNFKTYAFAAPMVGDKAFAKEYERKFCTKLSSFSIVNPADPIPKMPIAYKEGSAFSMQNIMAMITGGESLKSNVKNALLNLFSGGMEKVTGAADVSIAKRVEGALGEVEMPAYRKEWNFEPMATKLEVGPFPYPQSLADAAAKEKATEEGLNNDKVESDLEQLKKEPSFFQHKPYNYYVAVLERYFPAEYDALKVKVLPENL